MRSLGCILVMASVVACGNDPGEECPQLKPCNVTLPTCQAHALSVAQCWRGDTGAVAVSVSLQSRTEFARINTEDATKAQLDPDATVIRRGFALFDLSPWNFVERQSADAQSQWVAAYYNSDTKKIVIITERQPDPHDVEILVHEYVHALQDASGDLGRRSSTTFDEFLAGRGTSEGEARLIQNLSLATGRGFTPASVDFEKAAEANVLGSDWHARQEQDLLTYAYPLFAYSYGFRHLLSTWRTGGAQGVKAAWMSPPLTTRQFVAGPEAPTPPSGWSEDISTVAVPKVAGDFRLIDVTSLGQWMTHEALSRASQRCATSEYIPDVAADSISIWHSATTGVVLSAWRIRFATVSAGTARPSASELITAIRTCTTHSVTGDSLGLTLLATSSVPSAPEGLVTGWGPVQMPPVATVTRSTAQKLGLIDGRTVHGLYGHALRD